CSHLDHSQEDNRDFDQGGDGVDGRSGDRARAAETVRFPAPRVKSSKNLLSHPVRCGSLPLLFSRKNRIWLTQFSKPAANSTASLKVTSSKSRNSTAKRAPKSSFPK